MTAAASDWSSSPQSVSSSLSSEVRWLMENVVVPLEVVPLLCLPLLFLWAVHLQVDATAQRSAKRSRRSSAVRRHRAYVAQ